MDTTTFAALTQETEVVKKDNGISVFAPSCWVVDGEDRLSYTTIIRLVECCREYHWNKDAKNQNSNLDSICGSLSSKFIKSIKPNSTIDIDYVVKGSKGKKYQMEFTVRDEFEDICCLVEMICFFYDPIAQQSIEIPYGFFSSSF